MGMKLGRRAAYMLNRYKTNTEKHDIPTIKTSLNDDSAYKELDEARLKIYDASLYFARNFTTEITANGSTKKGKIQVFLQRVIRKLTKNIIMQLANRVYDFEYRALEGIGEIYKATLKQEKAIHTIIDEHKSIIQEVRDQQAVLITELQSMQEEKLSEINEQQQRRMQELRDQQIIAITELTNLHEKKLSEVKKLQESRIQEVKDQQETIVTNFQKQNNEAIQKIQNQRELIVKHETEAQIREYSANERISALQNQSQQLKNRQENTQKQIDYLQKVMNEQTLLSFEVQKIKCLLSNTEMNSGEFQNQKNRLLAENISLKRENKEGRNTGFPSFSQCGEDGILNYLLFVVFRKDPYAIRYLDIGCNDFRSDNNTYYLYLLGASGVVVDANPACVETFRETRPRDTILNIGIDKEDADDKVFYVMNNYGLSSFSRESVDEAIRKNPENKIEKELSVPVLGINTVLKKYFKQEKLDVLSIDAEGIDARILDALDFDTYNPKIIIVETIDYAPWVVIENKRKEIMDIMKDKGYIEYAFTGINSIFIEPSLVR